MGMAYAVRTSKKWSALWVVVQLDVGFTVETFTFDITGDYPRGVLIDSRNATVTKCVSIITTAFLGRVSTEGGVCASRESERSTRQSRERRI